MTVFVLFLAGCEQDPKGAPESAPVPKPVIQLPTPPRLDTDGDGSPDAVDCAPNDPEVCPGCPDVCGDARVTDCGATSDAGLATVNGVATTRNDLAAALAVAGAGDEVLVCEGTYFGSFVVPAGVTLRAHRGSAVTVLESGADRTVFSAGGVIDGFTITSSEPFAARGGIDVAGDLTLVGCVVRENQASPRGVGGGIRVGPSSTVSLVDTVVTGNTAATGGGLWLGDGATATLVGSRIEDNEATDSGGGVYLGPGASLTGGDVVGNRVIGHPDGYWYDQCGVGGGVAVDGPAQLAQVAITDNEAPCADYTYLGYYVYGWSDYEPVASRGGGIHAAGSVVLTDVTVARNSATWGGGVSIDGGDLGLEGTTSITDNAAVGELGTQGGGVYAVDSRVLGGTISGNDAYYGGGLWLDGPSAVERTVISANTAYHGGGARVVACRPCDLVDVTFDDNVAQYGAALDVGKRYVFFGRRSRVVLRTSTVRRNLTAGFAGAAGGAFNLSEDDSLTSDASSWGVGADANDPADVTYRDVDYSGFGAAADFVCDGATGTCL